MNRNLRLLILTHNYPRYEGDFAGVFISLLAKKLVQYGITPIILAPHDPEAAEREELDGVNVRRFRYAETDQNEDIAYRGNMQQLVLRSPSGLFKFKHFLDSFRAAAFDIIEQDQIEVVAGHWLVPSGMVMKTIAAQKQLPMVMSSHGTDVRMMQKYWRALYRYMKRFCRSLDRWTVVSSFLRDTIIEFDPKLASVLEVLPLPHDESIFHRINKVNRESGLVVAVTRFTGQKRVDYLINAFALVADRNPSARLEIYGSGPGEYDIRQLISKNSLESKITIRPPVPQLQLCEAYNKAAVVVLNSYREGFGLALSEAMMCGAAVIGTNSGGITDIISHEKTGLLVPLDNSEELAAAIVRLLEDKALHGRLSTDGHDFAHQTFASDRLAGRYAEIIKRAASA